MIDKFKILAEFPSIADNNREALVRASLNAGEASAMVANSYAAGRLGKAEIWLAEQNAWLKRKDELVAAVPLSKHAVGAYAAEIVCVGFTANAIEA